MSEAKDFIERAGKLGYKPEMAGEWIKWEPPLPVEMLIECSRLANDIAKELKANP